MIIINIANQTLTFQNKIYSISSAINGVGEEEGSFKTPLGRFKIAEKFGQKLPLNSVFKARVATGEIYTSDLSQKYPDRDWILTRILWLEGVQSHNENTKERYIYIHGSPDDTIMGVPGSKGCIRMKNSDIIKLFEKVKINEEVTIQ